MTLPEVAVTIYSKAFYNVIANDHGDVGFFLGVSLIISPEKSRRLLSISSLMLLMGWRKKNLKFNLNTVVTSDNYYVVCLEVDGDREDGRRNSVTLFRIPADSDNSIVNSQVTGS